MQIDDFSLGKCIGQGSFGEVYLTSKQGSQEKFATKKIDKKYAANPKAKKYIDNEIKILKEIDHPNIIKLYDVKENNQNFNTNSYNNLSTVENNSTSMMNSNNINNNKNNRINNINDNTSISKCK